MKKLTALLCVLFLLLGLAGCGETGEVTRLGSSGFSIVLPEGYAETPDELDEDQVAYYFKDDESIDFDVYQWAKGGSYTLESEAEYYAAQYGGSAEEVNFNGIAGMKYISQEDYEGESYTVLNYMFDDGENLVELCFWTVNSAEEIAAAEAIVGSISAG